MYLEEIAKLEGSVNAVKINTYILYNCLCNLRTSRFKGEANGRNHGDKVNCAHDFANKEVEKGRKELEN